MALHDSSPTLNEGLLAAASSAHRGRRMLASEGMVKMDDDDSKLHYSCYNYNQPLAADMVFISC